MLANEDWYGMNEADKLRCKDLSRKIKDLTAQLDEIKARYRYTGDVEDSWWEPVDQVRSAR